MDDWEDGFYRRVNKRYDSLMTSIEYLNDKIKKLEDKLDQNKARTETINEIYIMLKHFDKLTTWQKLGLLFIKNPWDWER